MQSVTDAYPKSKFGDKKWLHKRDGSEKWQPKGHHEKAHAQKAGRHLTIKKNSFLKGKTRLTQHAVVNTNKKLWKDAGDIKIKPQNI